MFTHGGNGLTAARLAAGRPPIYGIDRGEKSAGVKRGVPPR